MRNFWSCKRTGVKTTPVQLIFSGDIKLSAGILDEIDDCID